MTINVVRANSDVLRREAFRLRYRVLVGERGFTVTGANADEGLVEAEDATSVVFIAFEGGCSVGTLAVDRWSETKLRPEVVEHLQLEEVANKAGRSSIVIVRKLLVTKSHRTSEAAFMLFEKAIADVAEPDVRFAFIDCSPYLVPYYQRLGFRHWGTHFYYDGVLSVPMCLDLSDLVYLAAVESPLLGIIQSTRNTSNKPSIDGASLSREAIEAPPEGEPHFDIAAAPLLADLPGAWREQVLARAQTLNFAPRTRLLRRDDRTEHLLLLGAGYAEVLVRRDGRPLAVSTLGPGDLVGEISMLLDTGHTADVLALTAGYAFRLPYDVFSGAAGLRMYRNLAVILAERLRLTSRWITERPPL